MPMIVPLALLRKAIKVDLEEDDPELTRLEAASVALLEDLTGYCIRVASKVAYFKSFCDATICAKPVNTVTAVQYTDTSGNVQTLSASNWFTDLSAGPLVVVRFVGSLPVPRVGSVKISFTVGDAPAAVPEHVIQAIIALTALMFTNVNAAVPLRLEANPAYQSILDSIRVTGWLR